MLLFGVSHRFETLIKVCRVLDSFMLLASFEFSVGVYGQTLSSAASTMFFLLLLG